VDLASGPTSPFQILPDISRTLGLPPAPLLVVLPRRVRMQLLAQDQFASSEPICTVRAPGQHVQHLNQRTGKINVIEKGKVMMLIDFPNFYINVQRFQPLSCLSK